MSQGDHTEQFATEFVAMLLKRSALAHGTTISKAAAELRELVIGRPGQHGLLRRLAELLEPI